MLYSNGSILIGGKSFYFQDGQVIFCLYNGGSRPAIKICDSQERADDVRSWDVPKEEIYFDGGLPFIKFTDGSVERIPMKVLKWKDKDGVLSDGKPYHRLNSSKDGLYDENFGYVVSPKDGGTYYKKSRGGDKLEHGIISIHEENTYSECYNRDNKDHDTVVSTKKTFKIQGTVLLERIQITI